MRSHLLILFRTGRGRPIAAAVLFLCILLTFFPDLSPFKTFRLGLFDSYQTCWPRERKSAPAVIVAIDETSLNLFGQWPWPRTRLAELLDHVISHNPAAVGVDIIMSEPDRASPSRMADSLPQISPGLRQSLKSLPDNDLLLAAALAGRPVVLGAAGLDLMTPGAAPSMRSSPVVSRGGDAGPHVRKFSAVLKSLPVLGEAAASQALLSADLEKGVVRRVPMVAAVGNVLVPALAIEILRVAGRLHAVEVVVGTRGVTAVGLGDIRIPTEANGEAWVHFAKFSADRYISAADLLAGRVHTDALERKLVLIGLTGVGLLDYQTTPRGEQVPGIEVHAQLIENIFDGSYLRRPSWMPAVERGILFLGGILLLLAVPALRPRFSIALAAALSAVVFAAGILLYRTSGILFDAASVSTSLNTVFGTLLCGVWIETDRKRVLAQKALQEEREAAARVAGELEAARRIQMGSLPQPASAFPGEKRFDLDALLEPAREVGGDLYDFYMLDDRRLFFIVGDVSGKGLPASLFMVMTKSLTKTIIADPRADADRPLDRVNRILCAENPEMLFVTVFAAVLDVESGALVYCIAGHDAPWKVSASGAVGQLEGEGCLPLGVTAEADYPMERLELLPGDAIFVLTDGIAEAMNPSGELYGDTRTPDLLRERGRDLSPSELLRLVRNDVRTFVGSAEQSDDLTMLVLRWHGPQKV